MGNQYAKRAAKATAIVTAIATTAVATTAGIINAIGFTGAGVALGSAAAGIQSGIGCVAAGSAFAACQSLGATGVLLSTVCPIVLGVGLGVLAVIGGYYFYKNYMKV